MITYLQEKDFTIFIVTQKAGTRKMSLQRHRPAVTIDLFKLKKGRQHEGTLTELPSPAMIKAKNRMNKMALRKTNEQVIQSSHQQLLHFVDTLDGKVQAIVQNHQAQFLDAYKEHVKRVRDQMEEIKQKSLKSANNQSVYLSKIETLEKQLAIFREDSLKLFDKLLAKDKQMALLKSKVKDLTNQLQSKQRLIYSLTKKTKVCQTLLQQIKEKESGQNNLLGKEKEQRFYNSESKHYKDLYMPSSKQLFIEESKDRPFSTQLKSHRSKSFALGIQSQNKMKSENVRKGLAQVKEKIEEKTGQADVVPVSEGIGLLSSRQMVQPGVKQGPVREFRNTRSNYMSRMQSRRGSYVLCDNGIKQLSKALTEENEFKEIFKKCVQEVKKELLKRNNVVSLNFFKSNGPQDYLQFKKVDYMYLMQLVVSNEKLLKKIYELIFT